MTPSSPTTCVTSSRASPANLSPTKRPSSKIRCGFCTDFSSILAPIIILVTPFFSSNSALALLILFFQLKRRFPREFTLLVLLELFAPFPAHVPFLSFSRGNAAFRTHALLPLLLAFFDPPLAAHFAALDPHWWYPLDLPLETQPDFVTNYPLDPPQGTPQETGPAGIIPTAWLLTLFLEPDATDEAWSPAVTDALLDRAALAGNPAGALFFTLAMLEGNREEWMAVETVEECRQRVRNFPREIEQTKIAAFLEQATRLRAKLPPSMMEGITAVIAQSSPGLLPPFVAGNPDLWYSRLVDLYT